MRERRGKKRVVRTKCSLTKRSIMPLRRPANQVCRFLVKLSKREGEATDQRSVLHDNANNRVRRMPRQLLLGGILSWSVGHSLHHPSNYGVSLTAVSCHVCLCVLDRTLDSLLAPGQGNLIVSKWPKGIANPSSSGYPISCCSTLIFCLEVFQFI